MLESSGLVTRPTLNTILLKWASYWVRDIGGPAHQFLLFSFSLIRFTVKPPYINYLPIVIKNHNPDSGPVIFRITSTL